MRGREAADPALDRSRPALPMMPGVPERCSHDYVHAGTAPPCSPPWKSPPARRSGPCTGGTGLEFKKFLAKLDKEVPSGLDAHLGLDNYVTHKASAVKKWLLLAHPRFRRHLIPTSPSWLDLVERGFAELTQKKPKHGVHRSTQVLECDS